MISERHRHRYEVNVNYKDRLEQVGLRFSGMSPDGILPEIVEIPDHPWFIGVQYHPELKSRPFAPHPLFTSFIGAAKSAEPAGLAGSTRPVRGRISVMFFGWNCRHEPLFRSSSFSPPSRWPRPPGRRPPRNP